MSKKETKIISQGEKTKKFKMPKFPSALVVLFIVLLFVVLLSWIPHKGWVDTTNPLLYFTEEGLFLPDPNGKTDILIAEWTGSSLADIGACAEIGEVDNGLILTLKLTSQGELIVNDWLIEQGFSVVDAGKIVDAASAEDGIMISNIVLGSIKNNGNLKDDWNAAPINYSGLSFTLAIASENELLLCSEIMIDKINVSQIVMSIDDSFIFTFNLLQVSINELDGKAVSETLSLFIQNNSYVFESENIAGNWFNFWHTNYFVGDDWGRYGILNIPFLLVAGVLNASGIILFILCTGAFVKVMTDSGALEAGTVSLVNKLKGKELLLIPIFFTLFCLIGTTAGIQSAIIGLVPLVVPFLVFAGFDTMTALLVIVAGNTSGIAASILDPFSVGVMSSVLVTEGPEDIVRVGTGIVIRIIEFFAFAIAGSLFCTWYGNRSRKGKDYVAEPEMFEANKKWAEEMLGEVHQTYKGLTRRQAIGLGIFAATFGIMLFGLLPWTDWFPNLADANWWIGLSSIFFAKVLFGDWYFIQLSFLFLISGLILGKVFGMKQKETNNAIAKGAKGMLGVAAILTITRSVSLVLTYSGLTTAMIAMMFSGASGGGFSTIGLAWVLFPMFTFLAIFISSTSGLAAITGPIIAPIIWQLSHGSTEQFLVYAAVVMATYPLAQGIVNMCMPTTGIVVVEAELARVNFGKAFKFLGITAIGTAVIGMIIISASIPIMMLSKGLM